MVDRYEPTFDDVEGVASMEESEFGSFVSFDDYQSLFSEKEEIADKFQELKDLIADIGWHADKIRV